MKETVLIVDSVEHIRGTSVNADDVQRSIEQVFVGHADKLHLPNLHVIYTIHPYLKVRAANLGSLYAPGGVQVLPTVKVKAEKDGGVCQSGIDALERVLRERGHWERVLGKGRRDLLDMLIRTSGGHLRDLLRLMAEVIRRAGALPVKEATVEAAISQIRNEFLPLADSDAVWLARIGETHKASLGEMKNLPDLARFLDTQLVLCYWNGHEWYDVHPIIANDVREQAEAVRKQARPETVRGEAEPS